MLVVGPNGSARRTCSRRCTSARRGSRRGRAWTRSSSASARTPAGSRLGGAREASPVEVEVTLRPPRGQARAVNGAALPSAEQLRSELATLVFTPDRLAVVKGGPAVRRAYFDRVARAAAADARLDGRPLRRRSVAPQRRAAPHRGRCVGTRRSCAVDGAGRSVRRGARRRARGDAGSARPAVRGTRRASSGSTMRRSPTRALPRPSRPWRRGSAAISSAGSRRSARIWTMWPFMRASATCGSSARRASSASPCWHCSWPRPPSSPTAAARALLLLDDVLSELDGARRSALAARIASGGQTIVTATSAGALPAEPAQLVEVRPGVAA